MFFWFSGVLSKWKVGNNGTYTHLLTAFASWEARDGARLDPAGRGHEAWLRNGRLGMVRSAAKHFGPQSFVPGPTTFPSK